MILMETTVAPPAVLNLETFGLTSVAALAELGKATVKVKVTFVGPSVDDMRGVKPSERRAICERRAEETFQALSASLLFKELLKARIQPVGGWMSGEIEADRLPGLLLYPNVESIRVESVQGIRAIPQPQAKPPATLWYSVRERLALVPVEGEPATLDRVTKERVLLIQAASLQEAVEKAIAEAATHGQPFFNGNCELVRWELEEISEIFISLDGARNFNPNGAEVFTRVSSHPVDPFTDEDFEPEA